MRIVSPYPNLAQDLKKIGVEDNFLPTFLNADFLVIEERNNELIGLSAVGGTFHIGGIFVNSKYRGQGISTLLNNEREAELKKRKYSFFIGTTYSKNPTAKAISRILKDRKAKPLFAFNFFEGFLTTLYIQDFNWKGRFIAKLLKFFNTKFGTFCLAIFLKMTGKLWQNMIGADPANYPKLDICYSVKNFYKVNDSDF